MATDKELKKIVEENKVIEVVPPVVPPIPEEQLSTFKPEDFMVILQKLQAPARYITTAPTDTPKNFLDSIRFYDSGGVRRLYLFINASWRYVVLT